MLAIAISTFFALALFGSIAVIAMMFVQYRDRISAVIQNEFNGQRPVTVIQPTACRHRKVKTPQSMTPHRSLQPAPLRAAA